MARSDADRERERRISERFEAARRGVGLGPGDRGVHALVPTLPGERNLLPGRDALDPHTRVPATPAYTGGGERKPGTVRGKLAPVQSYYGTDGKCRVLVADPPWPTKPLHIRQKVGGSVPYSSPYPLMTAAEIKSFVLPPLDDECVLFLWRLSSMQELAIEVCKAWGFKVYGEIVWKKLTVTGKDFHGMGSVVRGSHETCLIGLRYRSGHYVDLRPASSEKDIITAIHRGHSRKPDEFMELVERLYPPPTPSDPPIAGTHVELFARRTRPGWSCYGNEINTEPIQSEDEGDGDQEELDGIPAEEDVGQAPPERVREPETSHL